MMHIICDIKYDSYYTYVTYDMYLTKSLIRATHPACLPNVHSFACAIQGKSFTVAM